MLYYKFTENYRDIDRNLYFAKGDILEVKSDCNMCLGVYYNNSWIFDVVSDEGEDCGKVFDDENCESNIKNEFISYGEVANIIKLTIKEFEKNNYIVGGYSPNDLINWLEKHTDNNLKIKRK